MRIGVERRDVLGGREMKRPIWTAYFDTDSLTMTSPLLSLVAVAVIFTILVDLNPQAYYITFFFGGGGGGIL